MIIQSLTDTVWYLFIGEIFKFEIEVMKISSKYSIVSTIIHIRNVQYCSAYCPLWYTACLPVSLTDNLFHSKIFLIETIFFSKLLGRAKMENKRIAIFFFNAVLSSDKILKWEKYSKNFYKNKKADHTQISLEVRSRPD